jgi:hypothetical protein
VFREYVTGKRLIVEEPSDHAELEPRFKNHKQIDTSTSP